MDSGFFFLPLGAAGVGVGQQEQRDQCIAGSFGGVPREGRRDGLIQLTQRSRCPLILAPLGWLCLKPTPAFCLSLTGAVFQ